MVRRLKNLNTPLANKPYVAPRALGIAVTVFMVAELGGMFVGMFLPNIVTSRVGTQVGIVGATLSAVGWATLVALPYVVPGWRDAYVTRSGLKSSPFFVVPLMAAVGWMFGYVCFAWTCPWVFNMAFGNVSTQRFVVTGWTSGSRGNCARPDVGRGLFVDGPRAFCISRSDRDRVPRGSIIQVEGASTVFGMNADKRYVVSPDAGASEAPR